MGGTILISLILAALATPTSPDATCTIEAVGTVRVSNNRLLIDSTPTAVWTAPENTTIVALGCDRDRERVALALERALRRTQVAILSPREGGWSLDREFELKTKVDQLALDRTTLIAGWSDRNGFGVSFLRWTANSSWEPRSISGPVVAIQRDPARRLWLVASGTEIRSYDYETFATRELFLFDDAIIALALAEKEGWFALQFASHLALFQLGNPLDRGRLPTRGRLEFPASDGTLRSLSAETGGFELMAGSAPVRIAPEPLRVAVAASPTPTQATPKQERPKSEPLREEVRKPAPEPLPESVRPTSATPPPSVPTSPPPPPPQSPSPPSVPAPPQSQPPPPEPPVRTAPPAQAETARCSAQPQAGQIAIEIEDKSRWAAELVVLGPDSLLKEAWRQVFSPSETTCVAITGLAPGRYRVVLMGPSGRSLATEPEFAAIALTPFEAPLLRFTVRGRR
jgi:hypothetical protein